MFIKHVEMEQYLLEMKMEFMNLKKKKMSFFLLLVLQDPK